jgi:hypothetical protein
MKNEQPEQLLAWLRSKPSLDELTERFPAVREAVRCDVAVLIAEGTGAGLPAYLKRLGQAERTLEQKYARSRGERKIGEALVRLVVQSRMAHLAVKQHLIAEATGIDKGKVRFNLINGFIAQKLLFRDGLERKPVSLGLFRLFWPLVWQRRLLMPLVQPEGIYCFYSRQLVDELARLIGARRCLEVAAGDGTLTSFLSQQDVAVTATDDHSWHHEVRYPDFVEKRDAQDALRKYEPEVVICSWPPAGNGFEQQIFRTRSVQLYIVIGSRHRIAAGNWHSYQEQSAFEYSEEPRLSALVLPPELDSAVYLFKRKEGGQAG